MLRSRAITERGGRRILVPTRAQRARAVAGAAAAAAILLAALCPECGGTVSRTPPA